MAKAETKTILKAYSTVESKLSTLPPEDGQLIFVYDKKKIILDNHGVRTVYEQIQTIETEEQRNDLLAPIDSFYFVIEKSILWRYTNGHWNQITTSPQEQIDRIVAEGAKQVKAVQDKGTEVLQSIPEDFQTQMRSKLDKQQGVENKGKALVIGEDGLVVPGEVQSGGDGIAIINTMSGESPLVIPDSAERVNKRLELGGKTDQFSTKGLNLFNYKDFVDISTYADEGAGYRRRYLQLKPNTSYRMTIFKNRMSPSVDATVMFIGNKEKYDNTAANGKIVLFTSTDKKSATIVTGESGQIVFKLNKNSTPELQEEYLSKADIILSEGSTEIPYEPYTGGKPSPSPEYPQEIKNSGKWNEEKQKYEIEVVLSGKNLLDITACEDGKIFEGNGNIISADNGLLTDFIPCFPNSQYSRSRTGFTVVAFYDCDKNKIGFEIVGNATFVTPEKCRYFRYSINKVQVDYKKLVACPGDTVMDYEPYYHKPIFLNLTSDRPLTKWDRLVEQGGEIGWLYGTKKYTVTGSENYIFGGAQYYSGISTNMYITNVSKMGKEAVCRRLKSIIGIWDKSNNTKDGFCINSGNQIHMRFFNNLLGVSDDATMEEKKAAYIAYLKKEYEKGTPYEIVYQSLEPEFVPLPQSEQNAIRALKTYYPTTVITADGGELDPDIKVTYTADTKNYIDGKVSAKVASILRQYQADTANLLSLMPMETQATMIENDTNNILNNLESEEAHE